MKLFILILFVLVLAIDFGKEMYRKRLNAAAIFTRGFMICAAAYLLQGVQF